MDRVTTTRITIVGCRARRRCTRRWPCTGSQGSAPGRVRCFTRITPAVPVLVDVVGAVREPGPVLALGRGLPYLLAAALHPARTHLTSTNNPHNTEGGLPRRSRSRCTPGHTGNPRTPAAQAFGMPERLRPAARNPAATSSGRPGASGTRRTTPRTRPPANRRTTNLDRPIQLL